MKSFISGDSSYIHSLFTESSDFASKIISGFTAIFCYCLIYSNLFNHLYSFTIWLNTLNTLTLFLFIFVPVIICLYIVGLIQQYLFDLLFDLYVSIGFFISYKLQALSKYKLLKSFFILVHSRYNKLFQKTLPFYAIVDQTNNLTRDLQQELYDKISTHLNLKNLNPPAFDQMSEAIIQQTKCIDNMHLISFKLTLVKALLINSIFFIIYFIFLQKNLPLSLVLILIFLALYNSLLKTYKEARLKILCHSYLVTLKTKPQKK